ncbi:hypothetical protein OPIT5_00060 (plasmid) [Opitutaceae bacterium TAV5]|nr:hypothetical protein OPIT5_00060 [Opitutaceae bacterium TAV5]
MMRHPDFRAAKYDGDIEAARRLVKTFIDVAALDMLARRHNESRLIVVGGAVTNRIPDAFAEAVSETTGFRLDRGVLKQHSPKHTGKTAMRRFLSRATFAGRITGGANYIALDDVMTQGGTVSELRQFLQRQGSRVVAVATLSFTPSKVMSDGIHIAPTPESRRILMERLPPEPLSALLAECGIYGGNLFAMTESEIRLLLRFSSFAELEDAVRSEKSAMESETSVSVPLPVASAAISSRLVTR